MTSFRLPCRTEPIEPLPDRLVAALYVLLRDHIHPGDIEQVTMDLAKMPEGDTTTYSNPHLEALARAYASFLLSDQRTYPYQDGDVLVIGPECFVSQGANTEDNPVISYRGRNFSIPGTSGPMRAQGWKDAIEYLRAEAGNEYQDGWAAAIEALERVADSAESLNDSSDVKPDGIVVTDDGTRVGVYHKVEGTEHIDLAEMAGGPPVASAAQDEQAALTELAALELERARARFDEAARRPEAGARTPPMVVYSSEEPPNALAAFIAQELEHWGFTIESLVGPTDTPPARFRVVAGTVKLAVDVVED